MNPNGIRGTASAARGRASGTDRKVDAGLMP